MQSESNFLRNAPRLVVGIVALALGASFAACGGDDSAPAEGSTSSETTSKNVGGGSNHQGQGSGQNQDSSHVGQPQDNGPKSYSVAEVSVPVEISGGGAEQFLVKNGDNSIAEFGGEGDESEVEAAAQAVHDFYVARATGHWSDACSRMSAKQREQLKQLAAKSTSVRGCPGFLEAFTSQLPASTWREITTIDAGSLRREGDSGFLIYTGADEAVHAMPLREEDGEWKVTALASNTLG